MNVEQQKISEWFEVAEKDLRTAEMLLGQDLWAYDILCFHCQQCAEKYLKGLLVFYGDVPPKTHDIRQLIAVVLKHDQGILALQDAVDLNDYAVRYRYPDHLEIDDKKVAERALKLAVDVKAHVRRVVELK